MVRQAFFLVMLGIPDGHLPLREEVGSVTLLLPKSEPPSPISEERKTSRPVFQICESLFVTKQATKRSRSRGLEALGKRLELSFRYLL